MSLIGYYPNQLGEFLSQGTFSTVSTGNIILWAGLNTPDGFLLCDGSAVLVSQYPLLYQTIQTKYNVPGVPAGYFNVPDLRGRQVIGRNGNTVFPDLSGALGGKGGATRVNMTAEMLPEHNHTMRRGTAQPPQSGNPFPTPAKVPITTAVDSGTVVYDSSGNPITQQPLIIVQPYLTMKFIIKT
jgi:microcystin-dependent protein